VLLLEIPNKYYVTLNEIIVERRVVGTRGRNYLDIFGITPKTDRVEPIRIFGKLGYLNVQTNVSYSKKFRRINIYADWTRSGLTAGSDAEDTVHPSCLGCGPFETGCPRNCTPSSIAFSVEFTRGYLRYRRISVPIKSEYGFDL